MIFHMKYRVIEGKKLQQFVYTFTYNSTNVKEVEVYYTERTKSKLRP